MFHPLGGYLDRSVAVRSREKTAHPVRGMSTVGSNPLAELVAAHCQRTGESLATVAARGGMSRQTLSGLVNREGPTSMPRHTTLVALSTGLGLPFETVRQVAAETAYGNGHQPDTRRLVTILMSQAEGLTDGQLEVLLATTRALRNLG